MAERGEATPEDIDTAMELGTGHREFHRHSRNHSR